VIRLGLRLAVGGGREALTRLAVIAVAVAIGVALLLVAVAGTNAVHAQNERYAWLQTGFATPEIAGGAPAAGPVDPLWWSLRRDGFDGEEIGRIDVAATGPRSPVPPGIRALPGPGEFYASPALTELLDATPDGQLDDRYGGTQVGMIGPEALPAPEILIVVVGREVDELADQTDAKEVTSISTVSPSECGGDCGSTFGINTDGISLLLAVVGTALLFPVLIFIGSAARLSATRREQRFAAMRLVGATPRQVSLLSTVESSVAAVVGMVAGFGVFFALRSPLAAVPFTGARFYVSDLSLRPIDVVLVAVGVPVAAAVAARLALQRVQISPLGASRRTTPRPPRAWRVIPLAAGVAELGWFASVGRPATTSSQILAYLPGILLIMIGLVVAGPWLTMVGARLMAGRARRPAVLIAGRRLSDSPQAGFRAISGLVLALFIGSASIGTIATVVAAANPAGADADLLVQQFFLEPLPATSVPDGLVDRLGRIDGVVGVAVVHMERAPTASDVTWPPPVVSCADLAKTPSLGRCPDGAETVTIDARFTGAVIEGAPSNTDTVWPASDVPIDRLDGLPVHQIIVVNDGSTAAIELARTVLETTVPDRFGPETVSELNSHISRDLRQYQQLANVVILASLVIAGCSLAVSVAGGLTDRRRPFSLLRLTGVPVAMLRRVVAFETVVPLLITAAVAAGSGFVAAHLFVRAQMDRNLQPPGVAYYAVVLAGLVVSLVVIASTLPLLERMTGPESVRNE